MKNSIVLLQTAFLGDLLLGVPFYKKMRERWPQHQLVLICKKGLGDFFLKTELFDVVFEVEKGNSQSYSEALKQLNLLQVEVLFCPHQSFRSLMLARKIKAKTKIGFRKTLLSWVFDQSIPYEKKWPEPLRQMSLFWAFENSLNENAQKSNSLDFYKKSSLGHLQTIPDEWHYSLKEKIQNSEARQDLLKKLNLDQAKMPFVAIFPGSVWATKMWTAEGFAKVGQHLSKNYQVLVMGGKEEAELAKQIAEQIPSAINLAGKTNIYESAAMLAKCKVVIANDSAASHLASLVQAPILSVFGPTILQFGYRPWSSQAYIAEVEGLSCRPCGPHGHHQCPIGTHECMTKITAENVSRQIDSILQSLKN